VPSESDLRDLLQGSDPEGRAAIDLDAVLTRARRRRRPKVVAAQALGSVAVVGALFTAVVAVQPPPQAATMIAEDADGAGDEFASAPEADSALKWMPDSCGAPVTDAPTADGLVLEMEPVVIQPGAGSTPVAVPVTLTNLGPTRVVGVSGGTPHLTLSSGGTVVWHTYSVQSTIGMVVDLDPGESMAYDATLEPAVCETEDDLMMIDPAAPLPPAPPGAYELRSALVVTLDDGSGFLTAGGGPVAVDIR
jgi:hypothetical protein